MRRRYFLKNKKRFYSVIAILVTIMLSSFLAVSAHDDSSRRAFKTVVVKKGDTLWNIAREHNPNGDIRRIIYEIKKENHLDGSVIYIGDELIIPVHF